MNLRYLKNDDDLAVQDSVKRIGASKACHFGEMWMETWGRGCEFDDDSKCRCAVYQEWSSKPMNPLFYAVRPFVTINEQRRLTETPSSISSTLVTTAT